LNGSSNLRCCRRLAMQSNEHQVSPSESPLKPTLP
jgi:hypothetical protein